MVRGIARDRYWGIGDGKARRSMVCADDVARVVPVLAENGGVFHLTDGYHPSVAELEYGISAAMAKRRPRRLPIAIGRLAAATGDVMQQMGMRVPFNSATLSKLTSTLTFSDEKARLQLKWSPSSVLDRMGELLA
jgi:nucleoside-diphosphate-sugar epimerase